MALSNRTGYALLQRVIKTFLPVLCLSLAVGVNSNCIGQVTASTEVIEPLVKPYIDSETVMGLSLGVLQKGKFSNYGFGRLAAGESKTPDGDTVYEIGSITKVFTALMLADAVERKIVTLDQSIVDLFPSQFAKPHSSLSKIQLIQLSTHTSGLPRMPSNFDLTNVDNPYLDYDAAKMFEFLHDHRLTRDPGKKSEYSNLAVGLLGYLLANKQMTVYESLLKNRILEPFEMSDSSITLSESQKQRLAPGHDMDLTPRGNWDFKALASAGAIRSTSNDMLKFAQVMLHPNEKMKPWVDLAWQEHQPALAKTDRAMGLGWTIAGDGHTRFHNGQTGGYHSALFISRKLDLAVVALSNTAVGDIDRLAEDVFKKLAGDPVEPRKFEPKINVPAEVLKRYEGVYKLVEGVDFTVTVQDGKLMVGLTGQQTIRVYPKSETQFEYKVVKAEITFRQDKQGNWNELILFQNGIKQRAVRKQ